MWASSRFLMAALVAVLAADWLPAQDAKQKKEPVAGLNQPDEPFRIPFMQTDAWLNTRAWLVCFGTSPPVGVAWNPYGLLGARAGVGHPDKGAPDWKFVFDECLPIWQSYLDAIQDGRRLPNIERKELKELKELSRPDWGMYLALIHALERSDSATLDMFKKSAEANDHVGYSHLHGRPAQYRGRIITVKGRITRVKKDDAPRYVGREIQYVYSTAIQTPFKNEPPFVVLFTELPPDVSYKDKLDMEVTFYGYFLGNVLFAGDTKNQEKDVVAPYLVGKTLIVDKTGPPPNTESYAGNIIVWTVGGFVGVFVVAVLLHLWFRRGDRSIEAQLAQVRDKHLPFSVEPAEPAPPLADPVPPSEESAGPPLT